MKSNYVFNFYQVILLQRNFLLLQFAPLRRAHYKAVMELLWGQKPNLKILNVETATWPCMLSQNFPMLFTNFIQEPINNRLGLFHLVLSDENHGLVGDTWRKTGPDATIVIISLNWADPDLIQPCHQTHGHQG